MSWLTAPEALQVLGVRPQTLYANVSRKKIRAKPDPKDTRRSLYHEADVRKMARQHGGPRKATAVATAAIEWGRSDPLVRGVYCRGGAVVLPGSGCRGVVGGEGVRGSGAYSLGRGRRRWTA